MAINKMLAHEINGLQTIHFYQGKNLERQHFYQDKVIGIHRVIFKPLRPEASILRQKTVKTM